MNVHTAFESSRPRLVSLCARITGDRASAEDLAQETLLEAWRAIRKLQDPEGLDRWLAAIARNVCRRWLRKRGHEALLGDGEPVDAADDTDIEVELERSELVELLDRALGLLPPETRDVLVQRYVDESPHADIAARLGISVDAVSMRLTRGKLVLRRLLAGELREQIEAYGLLSDADEWSSTRLWCPSCGDATLQVRRDERAVSFRCPCCSPGSLTAVYALDNPFFARLVADVVRPSAILARTAEGLDAYMGSGSGARTVACMRCGRPVALTVAQRPKTARRDALGLFVTCGACGQDGWFAAAGIALGLPALRAFRRRHARLRLGPETDLERGGAPALVMRYEDVGGSSTADVVFDRRTLRVLDVAMNG